MMVYHVPLPPPGNDEELKREITGRALLQKLYDESTPVNICGGTPANKADVYGFLVDVPLYQELERFLYPRRDAKFPEEKC